MNLTSLIDHLPVVPGIYYAPFHPAHLEMMQPDELTKRSPKETEYLKAMIESQATSGIAITAYLHGRPVACFGIIPIWTGVAEMWLLIEERGRKYGKSLTRAAMTVRDFAVLSNNLHRLQITVRCADVRAVKWAKAIGFDPEAKLHKYGYDQSDFYIFART
jgi:RimJ/RimL family protein N-acetyltransferase